MEAGRVVLTASTSDAYAALFKLLCDPGDEVLVPHPSYPDLQLAAAPGSTHAEHLTRLEGVEAAPYALEYHGRWEINLAHLRGCLTPRTRAISCWSPSQQP